MSTSVVVPVHNHAALTQRCLDAVLAGLPPGCEVFVVDDASTDATPDLLRGYGASIRSLRLDPNGGFARACNAGGEGARGERLVFLNNDTVPQPGWLEALECYAAEHPAAAAVGAKLVYPTGSVQHAGVVIGQDGYPHNLYAGLPADHPAVNRSRRLQAVTGACMLVRRAAFERLGGFDVGFVNSLEDVDLCLRLGEAGEEVHYCHEAVLTHLESASRGRHRSFERSVALYRERWRDRVRRDDVAVYVEDGMLGLEYAESYPLRIEVSPRLAVVDRRGDGDELEAVLEVLARQVSDLLGEVVRLTVAAGEPVDDQPVDDHWVETPRATGPGFDREAFAKEANRLEEEVRRLQQRLEQASGGERAGGFTATRRLGYRRQVELIREEVARSVPPGASVLVVSRGDRALVDLDGCEASHFPQDPSGGYLGHHPRDSADAVARLEALRAAGAEYLVLPASASWWLDHYDGFAQYLNGRCRATALEACSIFSLGPAAGGGVLEGAGVVG